MVTVVVQSRWVAGLNLGWYTFLKLYKLGRNKRCKWAQKKKIRAYTYRLVTHHTYESGKGRLNHVAENNTPQPVSPAPDDDGPKSDTTYRVTVSARDGGGFSSRVLAKEWEERPRHRPGIRGPSPFPRTITRLRWNQPPKEATTTRQNPRDRP